MTEEKSRYDDIPSIVPERDELVSHRKKRRGNASSPPPVRSTGRSSGLLNFLVAVLMIGMVATGVGAYYFYQQSQSLITQLDIARNQILQIENRLSMVDEAAEQSSMGLLERVDFNFSEIDKLWAARNANRSDIAENKTAIENQSATLQSMEAVIGSQSASINGHTNQLTTLQTRLDAANNSINNLEAISTQLSVINEELNRVKSSMSTYDDSTIANRVSTIEQDIESINIYRLQLNQTISFLRDSVQTLQEQAAGQ